MSNPVPLIYPPRRPTNGLAVIGFVISILGFPLGLVLCPVGFIICFFALFKRPRGLAFAGMCIGLVGTAILAVILFIFGTVIFACITLGSTGGKTMLGIRHAQQQVNGWAVAHSGLPDEMTGEAIVSSQLDGWNRPLLYRRLGPAAYEIRSAGPDGLFNTSDDESQVYP